ncbi:MAG: patatin-like phospholipase family protein [Flavobacteriaceae bacterium]
MPKKYALVLSGGGFKGAFQVGALNYILNNTLQIGGNPTRIEKFDIVTGVSVGSLNGAMIATGQLEKLNELWFERIANDGPGIIYESKYIENGVPKTGNILNDLVPKLNFFQSLGALFSRKKRQRIVTDIFDNLKKLRSLADNSPLLDTLSGLIQVDGFGDTVFKMGYVSLTDGMYRARKATDFADSLQLNKAIVASTTMPIIWPPVDTVQSADGQISYENVDGGIRNITPLKDAIDEINERNDGDDWHIFVINCNSGILDVDHDKTYTIVGAAERALLEITLAEIFQNDVGQFLFVNDLLKSMGRDSVQVNGKTYRSFKIKIIQPARSMGETLDSSTSTLFNRREYGQQRAEQAFSREECENWNV